MCKFYWRSKRLIKGGIHFLYYTFFMDAPAERKIIHRTRMMVPSSAPRRTQMDNTQPPSPDWKREWTAEPETDQWCIIL